MQDIGVKFCDRRVILVLYEQPLAVIYTGEARREIKINKGVRQGRMLKPLFNIFKHSRTISKLYGGVQAGTKTQGEKI